MICPQMVLSRIVLLVALIVFAGQNASLPAGALNPLSFVETTPTGFGLQNVSNRFDVPDEQTLVLQDNTWVYVPLAYTITPMTVLEVELSTDDSSPEFLAIGFERDFLDSEAETVRFAGTQLYGQPYVPQLAKGETRHFRVSVGRVVAPRLYHYMTFARDQDTSPTGTAIFRNVRLYEMPFADPPVINWGAYPLSVFPSASPAGAWHQGVFPGRNEGVQLFGGDATYVDLGQRIISPVTRLRFQAVTMGTTPSFAGIGLYDSLDRDDARTFKVVGEGGSGEALTPESNDGIVFEYSVDLGASMAGESFRYLTFIRVEDVPTSGSITFGKVRLYEDSASKTLGWVLE